MLAADRSYQRGRLETNLARLPLVESNERRSDPRPLVGEALLGGFRANLRLKQLDLTLLAFILERWWWQRPDANTVPAEFTLREVGRAIYGRPPDGHERRLLRASLERLCQVMIDFVGFNAATGEHGHHWGRARLIQAIGGPIGRLGDIHPRPPAHVLGALRGSTFTVQLADWLAEQVRAGHVTYLDFEVLRRLSGLAQRLWVYLQAERYNERGETWIALGPRIQDILGINYARPTDARKAIRRAASRITEADHRYELVELQRRLGWGIHARRVPSAERRAARALIRASVAAARQHGTP